MRRKKNKRSIKEGLISLLQYRMKVLQSARQNYGQNPNLMKNVRMANIELIQNDIEDLKERLAHYLEEDPDAQIVKDRFKEHKSRIIVGAGKGLKKRLKK